MTNHIRIVNDPLELVPLLITFYNPDYKTIYDSLSRRWMTDEELAKEVDPTCVAECIALLKKGSLIEEKWRMPEPGKNPLKEYHTSYSKFRANFQCSMEDLSDLLHISIANDEPLRMLADSIESEVRSGNTSYNDLARKFDVSPVMVRGLAKRILSLDVKGQGLVLNDQSE